MAEIKMERKEERGGMGWLWILIALILLALLAWWLWPDAEVEEPIVTTPVEVEAVDPLPEVVADAPGVTLSEVLASPTTYTGQNWMGEVLVTDVPTDRGFWIEDQGVRLFALINDGPQEQPVHIQENMSIRIDEAVLRDATYLTNIPGEPIDADTERILNEQEIFLTVDEEDIQIVSEGQESM